MFVLTLNTINPLYFLFFTQFDMPMHTRDGTSVVHLMEQCFFLKVLACEENEELLRIKLRQMTEEKEELEFKVFEHEECFESASPDGVEGIQALEKNQKLELELSHLQRKLEKYEIAVKVPKRNIGPQCNRPFEAEQMVCREDGVKITEPSSLELSVKNLSDDFEGNDSGSELALSTTASSGFDETWSEAEEFPLTRDQRLSSNPGELKVRRKIYYICLLQTECVYYLLLGKDVTNLIMIFVVISAVLNSAKTVNLILKMRT